jgi:2-iminobutanoate/2-iminopropanoate deaminase
MKVVIQTSQAPAAIGPYSQAIKANGFLFISGQIPIDAASGQIEAVDITSQTKTVLNNIQGILNAEGLEMTDVVKTTIFLTDLADFTRVNEIYGKYFSQDPPARSTVQVQALPKGVKIEIEAIAVTR